MRALWRYAALLVLLGCAVAALALMLPGSKERVRWVPFGFNNNAVSERAASPQQTAALLSRLGAQIDRVQFEWRAGEPEPGRYVLGTYDAIYAADLARGIRPLFVFGFAPQWAAEPSCNAQVELCPPAAAHVADAARMAALLARRYRRLAGIEIWNEPNTPHFWFPRADVAAYTRLLVACSAAIKKTDPAMPVAGGSISDSPVFNSGYVSLSDFLRGIYRSGGAHSMDAIAVHPYPDPGNVSASTAVAPVQQAITARNASDDHRTPVWVTETGLSTTGPRGVSEVAQADGLVNLYRALASIAQVRMIIFHTLIPPPTATDSTEPGFAVVRSDWTPKAAFPALRAMLLHLRQQAAITVRPARTG